MRYRDILVGTNRMEGRFGRFRPRTHPVRNRNTEVETFDFVPLKAASTARRKCTRPLRITQGTNAGQEQSQQTRRGIA